MFRRRDPNKVRKPSYAYARPEGWRTIGTKSRPPAPPTPEFERLHEAIRAEYERLLAQKAGKDE